MSKENLAGVYQLENGCWGFRYAISVNGKRREGKKTKDENGNPFKTEKQAFRARERAIIKAKTEKKPTKKIVRKTFKEVFE